MHAVCFVLAAGWLLLGAAAPAIAQTAKAQSTGSVEFLLGGEQWQPGPGYRAGNDWLALVCLRTTCGFEPARLAVRSQQWKGRDDEKPSPGQKLVFSRQQPGPDVVLAWFRVDVARPWLVPGPVTTYAAKTTRPKRPGSEGTLEVAVDLPGGRQATLVPLFDRPGRRFLLQLRVPGQRQLLEEIGSCSHVVPPDFLAWAGDLDGDGKPDYLIDFADEVGEARLYLGQEADAGEIVGVAGVYVSPPYGGECDGQGWLE